MNTGTTCKFDLQYLSLSTILMSFFLFFPTIVYSQRLQKKERFGQCEALYNEDQMLESSECWIKFANEHPDSEFADLALCNSVIGFEKAGEWSEARRVRQRLISEFSHSEMIPDVLNGLALDYQTSMLFEKAAELYERLVLKYPNSEYAESAFLESIGLRQDLGQFDLAIQLCERYLELFPKSKGAGSIFFTIGLIYEEQQKYLKASKQFSLYLKKWGQIGPPERIVEAYVHSGLAYERIGDKKSASKAFMEAVKKGEELRVSGIIPSGDFGDARAAFMLAEADKSIFDATKIDETKELKPDLKKKIKLMEKTQKNYLKVLEYKEVNWSSAALYKIGLLCEEFAMAILELPRLPEYDVVQGPFRENRFNIIISYLEEKSIGSYEKSIQSAHQSDYFNEYMLLAMAGLDRILRTDCVSELHYPPKYIREGILGQFEVTVELAHKVLVLERESPDVIRNMVLAYIIDGDLGRAQLVGHMGLVNNPKHSGLNNALGLVAFARGDHTQAMRYFREAVIYDPNNVASWKNIGALSLEYRDFERAREAFLKVEELARDDPEVLVALGKTLKCIGEVDEGIERYNRVLQLSPHNVEVIFNLGIFNFEVKKDYDKSLEMFRRFLDMERSREDLRELAQKRIEEVEIFRKLEQEIKDMEREMIVMEIVDDVEEFLRRTVEKSYYFCKSLFEAM